MDDYTSIDLDKNELTYYINILKYLLITDKSNIDEEDLGTLKYIKHARQQKRYHWSFRFGVDVWRLSAPNEYRVPYTLDFFQALQCQMRV